MAGMIGGRVGKTHQSTTRSIVQEFYRAGRQYRGNIPCGNGILGPRRASILAGCCWCVCSRYLRDAFAGQRGGAQPDERNGPIPANGRPPSQGLRPSVVRHGRLPSNTHNRCVATIDSSLAAGSSVARTWTRRNDLVHSGGSHLVPVRTPRCRCHRASRFRLGTYRERYVWSRETRRTRRRGNNRPTSRNLRLLDHSNAADYPCHEPSHLRFTVAGSTAGRWFDGEGVGRGTFESS